MKSLILVPGLGNNDKPLRFLIKFLDKKGFNVVVCDVKWKKGEKNFKNKIRKVRNKVIELKKKGHRISLLGISAGGSIALCVFYLLNKDIDSAVVICSMLRLGFDENRNQKESLRLFPCYKNAVNFFEKNISPKLKRNQRKRILTIRPLFDEIVPIQTMSIEGANNLRVFLARHISIYIILFFFSDPIFRFIKSYSKY